MQAFCLQIADPNKVEMCAADPSIMVTTTFPTRVRPEVVIVKAYAYYTNGAYTGTLYLKEPVKQCSWLSQATGLRTGWHGEWVQFNGCGFVARFDCKGQANIQKHVVIYGNLQGQDYAGRGVAVIFSGRWRFEEEQAEYVIL